MKNINLIKDANHCLKNNFIRRLEVKIRGKRLFYKPISRGFISKVDNSIQEFMRSSGIAASQDRPIYVFGTIYEPKTKNRELKKIEMAVVSAQLGQPYRSVAGIKHDAESSFQKAWKRGHVSAAGEQNTDVKQALQNYKYCSRIRANPAMSMLEPIFSKFYLHQFAYKYDGSSILVAVEANKNKPVLYEKKRRQRRNSMVEPIGKNGQLRFDFMNDNDPSVGLSKKRNKR